MQARWCVAIAKTATSEPQQTTVITKETNKVGFVVGKSLTGGFSANH